MIKKKEESPQEAEADGEHQTQGELEVGGHVLTPEEVGDQGHGRDQGDAAEDDQGQDHHVVIQEVQLAMINASKSEDEEGRKNQHLRQKYQPVLVFPLFIHAQYSPAPEF